MNIETMSAPDMRKSQPVRLSWSTLLAILMLSASIALGQGFKMTRLEVPGNQANTTVPIAVNASQAVVGYGTAPSGATVGFLYSAGKYTTINWAGSENYTRALGINDSNEVVGYWLDSNGVTGRRALFLFVLAPPPRWYGPWLNGGKGVKNRYLGIRFQIKGQVHYGWARMTVTTTQRSFTATLTGYAYETIPGKPIIAGQTKEKDEAQGPTLGALAAGVNGLHTWK
jgi:hypothetical protein